MEYLDLTFPETEWNLALDEALLMAADAAEVAETLRIWENPQLAVIVGRSSRLLLEVDIPACRSWGVPILRRCSGGCAVVIGPGCLMYSLLLDLERRPGLRRVDRLHNEVLQTLGRAIDDTGLRIVRAGASDLALVGDPGLPGAQQSQGHILRKVSGNSVRYGKRFVLYHGTLLYHFDPAWMARLLKPPPRQPDYRGGRPHEAFVANLPMARSELVARLRRAWKADAVARNWPAARLEQLLAERYSQISWHWER